MTRLSKRFSAAACLIAALLAIPAGAQEVTNPFLQLPRAAQQDKAELEEVTREAAPSLPNAERLIRRPKTLLLPRMTDAEKAVPPDVQGPIVGAGRNVDADVLADGVWETLPNSRRVWRAAIQSPEARALRVHFTDFHVDAGKVWIYPEGHPEESQGPYTGAGIFEDGEFWSGVAAGDTVVIEYEADPKFGGTESVPFRIGEIVHIAESPENFEKAVSPQRSAVSMINGPAVAGDGKSASCHLDFNCYPQWSNTGKSVAAYTYNATTAEGKTWVSYCTGSLVDNPRKALYFLTANHCISTEAQARTVAVFWGFNSILCNQIPTAAPIGQRTGAHLKITGNIAYGDFTLLELLGTLPATAAFARISTNAAAFGETLTGIHHPNGSWKRVSFGTRMTDKAENVTGLGVAPANKFYQIQWTYGLTEGGSSGSPLFNSAGEVVGVLSYGDTDLLCNYNRSGYGRVSEFYIYLSSFLGGGSGGGTTATASLDYPVSSASYLRAVAPGSYISLFGKNLTTGIHNAASTPLPTSLGAVTLKINGYPAPLFYVSPTQINAQIPFEVSPGTARLEYIGPGGNLVGDFTVSAVAPGLFTTDGTTAVSFRQGNWVILYATGQGALKSSIPTGHAAPATPWIQPQAPIRVFSGNTELQVGQAMAPGYVGLLQINVLIPEGTPAGNYPLTVYAGNTPSKTVTLQFR